MVVLSQMIVLFIVLLIGVLENKKGIINDQIEKSLSWIVINIANPALIISSSLSKNKDISGKDLAGVMIISIAMYVGLIILAYIITKLLRVSKKEMGAYMVMFVFSNIAFMGYPVISGIYGKGALLYASLFSLPFNILIYTYGVLAIGGSTKLSDLKISKILNIGVLACIVSIILFATRIPMPGFVQTLTDMLGNLSAPLSMMVIGSSLVKMDIKSVLNDYKMIIFIVVKQLIFPILAAFAIKGLIDSELIYGIVVIMLAMPVGSMTAMLANQYNGDYELVSKGVAFSTLVSVISIPLISVIVGL